MEPESITLALGGQWHGHYGLAPCPVSGHGRGRGDRNPSLSIARGERQAVVMHCHAGCSPCEVIAALRTLGHWTGQAPTSSRKSFVRPPPAPDPRIRIAFKLWTMARSAAGSPAKAYLARRGLKPESPALRYLAREPYADLPETADGALVAALRSRGGEVHAVQLTYLSRDGCKANTRPVRRSFGPMGAAAVQLAPAGPVLGLAEGVETALSASLLHGVPVWAVCGARLSDAPVPRRVQQVVLFADNDPPGLGAADRAMKAFRAQSFDVSIRAPEAQGQDWNDVLLGRRRAKT